MDWGRCLEWAVEWGKANEPAPVTLHAYRDRRHAFLDLFRSAVIPPFQVATYDDTQCVEMITLNLTRRYQPNVRMDEAMELERSELSLQVIWVDGSDHMHHREFWNEAEAQGCYKSLAEQQARRMSHRGLEVMQEVAGVC